VELRLFGEQSDPARFGAAGWQVSKLAELLPKWRQSRMRPNFPPLIHRYISRENDVFARSRSPAIYQIGQEESFVCFK